jgi:hypothetical protein
MPITIYIGFLLNLRLRTDLRWKHVNNAGLDSSEDGIPFTIAIPLEFLEVMSI